MDYCLWCPQHKLYCELSLLSFNKEIVWIIKKTTNCNTLGKDMLMLNFLNVIPQ